MAKNIQNQSPAAAPEPTEPLEAIIEPATAGDCIKALISTLGHDPAEIAGVEISSERVRVLGKDRSFRSHKIEAWNEKEEGEDADA